jgi:hypothetical protein
MIKTMSHWGIFAECEGVGAASSTGCEGRRVEPAILLTLAGEIIIHKTPSTNKIAILIDGQLGGLTSAQQEQMENLWRLASSVLDAELELCPVPHSMRCEWENYVDHADWQSEASRKVKPWLKKKEGGHSWTQCT